MESADECVDITGIIANLRRSTLAFTARQHLTSAGDGHYRHAAGCQSTTLYSSCYAALTRSLYGDLDSLSNEARQAWIAYLSNHQDTDGLYRDPVIYDQGWYAGDPLWCGRSHLTCHVLAALASLGAMAEKPLCWLEPYMSVPELRQWLASRDWGKRVAWSGNEILNVGTLLQYSRDVQNDQRAGPAIDFLLDWLTANHLHAETGVWGDIDTADPYWRSQAVQAAYHWWLLFAYDRRPFPFVERAIDTVLLTQNPLGGFGWGVHNSHIPWMSSACEDIDSIDPLVRMSMQTDYRCDEVHAALTKAANWVLTNQMADSGFVFMRDLPFTYGHPALGSMAGQSALFPTWFRTLALSYIGMALPDHPLGQIEWQYAPCPGYQFWRES